MTKIKLKFLVAVTLLVLASTASAAITLPNCRTQTVTKNSPCEITLTSVATPANPYRDYTVTGSFTHVPTGKVYSNVLGFYDGASSGRAVFKIRFNPMVDGQYNFSISSSPADSGLTASGSFTAQPSTLRGFLRRSGNYPEDLVFDNTDRIFLWGMTYYQIINNALATGATGPWKTAVNTVADSYLINKIRMLVFPWWGDFSGQFNGTYVDAVPFFQKPSCAGDPRTCLNHDSIRPDHFRALDDVVFHLNSKNMIAELVMFKDHATVPGGTVVDGFRTFGDLTQDVRYTKYIVARYAAFPNVTWCLTNEWNQNNMPAKSPYWDTHIGGAVRSTDPYFVSPANLVRLSSIHAKGTPIFEFYANRAEWNNNQWATHAVMQYHQNNPQNITDALQWGYQGIRGNLLHQQNNGIPAMPVSNDEYGYILNVTRDQARQAAWGIAVAGGYGTMGDRRPVPNTITPSGSPAETTLRGEWVPANSAEYSDVRYLINFFANPTGDATKVQAFFRMRFQDGIIASGDRAVAGGQPGIQYVVYDANGGAVTVNLPQPQNPANLHYTVQVYNPRTGVWGATTTVNFGSNIALPAQAAGSDWAYLIKQAP
jgi:Domain of unknown function (DUF5060)/Protein of unknown function (DUF4038)